ncbi:hypothetical protein L2E82_00799 [Cichorium intybus]|uniref:Uncharacterized protein n=1 Tax=Cichorium intybus TaxID=13427 RepID=A0ACB9GY22_CICIN|nr:hypothetical protein L2E82_00799 [Cichorium intybus]
MPSQSTSESSSEDIITKPNIKHSNENLGSKQLKNIDSLIQAPMNGNEVVNGCIEVEYTESEKLNDFEDVHRSLKESNVFFNGARAHRDGVGCS